MKSIALAFILIFFSSLSQAQTSVPKDFSIDYEFVQGGPEKAATRESYRLKEGKLTLQTDFIPTEYGSDLSKRTQQNKTYDVSVEDLKNIWNIVVQNDFMNWPQSAAQRPEHSGNQSFTIKADGKTVTHSMWEAANRDKFTEFSRQFLQWAKRKMTIQL